MIASLWKRVPAEEQKLILGLLAALFGAGALKVTGHSVAWDGTIAGAALLRYLTDTIQRAVPPALPAAGAPPTSLITVIPTDKTADGA